MLRRALLVAAAALGVALAGFFAPSRAGFASPAAADADTLSATVATNPSGPSMAPGFVGVSFEFRAVHQYAGNNPLAIDPVLLNLLRGLTPGQRPVIRIGGNSTDGSWWPLKGMIPPGGIYYPITTGWLRTTKALAADLKAKLILGVNLAAGRPAIAAAEGRAYMSKIGRKYIDALEIGNEPNLYSVFSWYKDRRGHVYRSRKRSYKLGDYIQQFKQWSRALPNVPLAGPAASNPKWMGQLSKFIKGAPRLKLVTYHRYPLRGCTTDPKEPTFPSIPNLLADSSSAGLAADMRPFVKVAARHHLPFRVAEMNSASCEGAEGVSDTFASALWALDTMFNFAKAGVQGVNFHMLPGSHYELFSVSKSSGDAWQAFVHPEYYGLQMFAQAFPAGARMLNVRAPSGPTKVWATEATDGTIHVVVINQDTANEHDVAVTVPGQTAAGNIESLTAPSISATSGVTLGGQSYGLRTTTGTLPTPTQSPSTPVSSVYTIPAPAASAQMLTIPPPPSGGGSPIGH
ncbi:MAG TPA: glycosyl hydrolase family 79 C-terminal domain-containing protein [Solirubrobacteraceae bacterium]|nr:glycosyl hydrolase family 79 C-terminal domain-containing protein [Solirubrobacteraceae bacterium]